MLLKVTENENNGFHHWFQLEVEDFGFGITYGDKKLESIALVHLPSADDNGTIHSVIEFDITDDKISQVSIYLAGNIDTTFPISWNKKFDPEELRCFFPPEVLSALMDFTSRFVFALENDTVECGIKTVVDSLKVLCNSTTQN
jgi:hypothetical protein